MKGLRLPVATWTLVDQAVLSLGTFLFNIVLARQLLISAYGSYAMFIGIASLMQVVCGALLFYPLSVQGALLRDNDFKRLMVTGLALTVVLGLPAGLLLALFCEMMIAPGLFLPTLAALLAGQLQEAMRRGLLASFRHRDAVLGDATSYVGQVGLVLLVGLFWQLNLALALYAMALTSLAAALIQFLQLRPGYAAPLSLTATLRGFWSLGVWSLGSNLLNIIRGQCVPWFLTFAFGPASAGLFQAAVNISNVTNPVQTGISNVIPQAAARARATSEIGALRASLPYMLTGLPIVSALVLLTIAIPADLIDLAYRGKVDAGEIVTPLRLMAFTAVFSYLAAAGCAHLHGVNGGRSGLVADIVSVFAVLITIYPAIYFFGIAGACTAALFGVAVRAALIAVAIFDRLYPHRPWGRLPRLMLPPRKVAERDLIPSETP